MTPTLIYWLTRLDHIHFILFFTVAALVIGSIACGIMLATAVDNCPAGNTTDTAALKRGRELIQQCTRRTMIAIGFLALTSVGKALVPTTQEMAAIIALPAVANNQDVREIGQDITDLAKQWLEELKPAE